MLCKAFLIADFIDIKSLHSEIKLKESCYFEIESNKFVIFPYGVVVCWGDGNLTSALVLLKSHLKNAYPQDLTLTDTFSLQTNATETDGKLIFEDTIFLPTLDRFQLVAISHSIAQSLRLTKFEDITLDSFSKIKHIPQNLATHGKIKESKKQISKMQGHLYSLKSMIRLEYSILDKPEFFWDYPEYDELYIKMSSYLEIHQRLAIIDKKFETIDEILSILSSELNHRHSSRLEWIIIILILIEVIKTLLPTQFIW